MAQDSVKRNKNFNLAGIPVTSYNTSFGSIVGANTMAFFNLKKNRHYFTSKRSWSWWWLLRKIAFCHRVCTIIF